MFWKNLFRTHAEDPYRFAKIGFVAILGARLFLTLFLSSFVSISLLQSYIDKSCSYRSLCSAIKNFILLSLRFVSPTAPLVSFKLDFDVVKENLSYFFSKSDTYEKEEDFDNKRKCTPDGLVI